MADSGSSRGTWILISSLGVLALLTLWLGQIRIFQVDEVQWAYQSRILGTHAWGQASSSAPLWLLGPLAWWGKHGKTSADILQGDRLAFTVLFWINGMLLVKAAGFRLRSIRGGLVLLAAATLEPMWDYGFEIRHDNVLLTGILLLYLLLAPRAGGRKNAYIFAGGISALLQLCAFKAFLYWAPISILALIWPHPAQARKRLRLAVEWAAGFLSALGVGLLAHAASGTWGLYWNDLLSSFHASAQVERFSPWMAFGRLFTQAPLLLGGVVAFLLWVSRRWKAGEFKASPWESGAAEAALLAIATLVLLVNPTPFPYNLVLWVPFAFLAVLRLRDPLEAAIGSPSGARPWVLCGLFTAHLAPWMALTPRHWDHTNDRQIALMDAAERLTGPQDAVCDGAGLVIARPAFAYHWLLHTLTMPSFLDGTYPSIRQSLTEHAVPVILPSYRTDWLPDDDKTFIVAHYVPLAQDCWVLGGLVAAQNGTWDCLHEGRYQLVSASGRGVMLDGQAVQEGATKMEKGAHHLQAADGGDIRITWLGPRLSAPPRLGEPSGALFQNWY